MDTGRRRVEIRVQAARSVSTHGGKGFSEKPHSSPRAIPTSVLSGGWSLDRVAYRQPGQEKNSHHSVCPIRYGRTELREGAGTYESRRLGVGQGRRRGSRGHGR